jgi:hypothetical protein
VQILRREQSNIILLYWSGFKLILLVGRMVDFLVKQTPCFCHSLETQTGMRHVDARWIADGTSAKHGEKNGGVFGKAHHTFCHVFLIRN